MTIFRLQNSSLKPKYIIILFLAFITLINSGLLKSQCTVSSGCGYNLDIHIKTLAVVPTTTNCTSGYNYDIRFSYTITVSGINTCYNDVIGFQPMINCLGQNSSYYTLNVAAPIVGAPSATTSVTGTLVTATNQYNSANDCASATPASLNCSSLQITIFGPGLSSTTYPCSLSSLPVSLITFNAVLENGSVILKWTTATEKNNRSFFVERSNDGSTWTSIAQVRGAGTSVEVNRYQSEDRDFDMGINYYRLRQVDDDESFKYSEIVAIQTDLNTSSFRYFPNPFQTELLVEYGGQEFEIEILNNLSKLIYSNRIHNQDRIDLSSQPAGIYFLSVKNGSEKKHYKLIKN